MIRTIVVDDHELVRAGLRRLLAEHPEVEVVGEAEDGEGALRLALADRPDIVLLDLNMPGLGGLETTRRLLRLHPAPRVIVVSVHTDGPMPAQVLRAGASGYLSKHAAREELLNAVVRVHRGERFVSADVARSLALDRLFGRSGPAARLTHRELSVVMMLSLGQPRDEISTRLCISPKTVSTYRTRALRKLGVRSDVELTHLSLRYGLVDPLPVG
jgi:two-component system, NarL family, invasion response regulator UvrY